MSKKILITAGTVYGKLDDNKLVGNRIRGIWASRFAAWLADRKHEVVLLLADIQKREIQERPRIANALAASCAHDAEGVLEIIEHKGFWDYRQKVHELVPEMDAVVLAAAVVNWIPAEPYLGKMPTKDYKPGESRIEIPFLLAPRVIDEVKHFKQDLTLIGCKMTAGAPHDQLMTAAYETLLSGRCNVVVANDLYGLRRKHLVHVDRTAIPFEVDDPEFYGTLEQIILDEHYRTDVQGEIATLNGDVAALFDRIVDRHRESFVLRLPDGDRVFGAVAVRYPGPDMAIDSQEGTTALRGKALVSPREKGQAFTWRDAVIVSDVDHDTRAVRTVGGKATLNAPLLLRHLEKYPNAAAVLHLHEQLIDDGKYPIPTVPYAPPGTVRDNQREIPGPIYNIEGHGCIATLDDLGQIWQGWHR
jgi:hypothetical protein